MSELSFPEAIHRMTEAVTRRRPFSFVRCGDGEGIVLGYPEFTKEKDCVTRLYKWVGPCRILPEEMVAISNGIRQACKEADIVGLPGNRHQGLNQSWRNVTPFMSRLGLVTPRTVTVGMDVVLVMQLQDRFRALLKAAQGVRLVTCRNVAGELMSAFGLGARPDVFFLPPQAKPKLGVDYANGLCHWPRLFSMFPDWLRNSKPRGNLYLVGAGGLGKIYCAQIKKAGGIALDIGSIFDGWAGLATRTYLREAMPQYRIRSVHSNVAVS